MPCSSDVWLRNVVGVFLAFTFTLNASDPTVFCCCGFAAGSCRAFASPDNIPGALGSQTDLRDVVGVDVHVRTC